MMLNKILIQCYYLVLHVMTEYVFWWCHQQLSASTTSLWITLQASIFHFHSLCFSFRWIIHTTIKLFFWICSTKYYFRAFVKTHWSSEFCSIRTYCWIIEQFLFEHFETRHDLFEFLWKENCLTIECGVGRTCKKRSKIFSKRFNKN